jgi:hypothetical protein
MPGPSLRRTPLLGGAIADENICSNMKAGTMFSAITSFFYATALRPSASTSSTDASMAVHARPSTTGNQVSCQAPTYPCITSRTSFNPNGCTIYGYPSQGGILVKEKANILDMNFLSLPRIHAVERSYDSAEEDAFCKRLRRVGATWWQFNQEWIQNLRKYHDELVTDEQKRIMVYGWPADGRGVWVLKYEQADDLPNDFGKVRMAADMEEKIEAMRALGAEFVADLDQVEELRYPAISKLCI